MVDYIFKVFRKPWNIKYSNISLMAMLTHDLQRYHLDFVVAVVDQVFEDIRKGLEVSSLSYQARLPSVNAPPKGKLLQV